MLFKTDRFGMFIHFGIYAVNAWHEQEQMRRGIAKNEYIKNADIFNPYKFDAEKWVLFAKESGAQYICFTTKHHDGFCMWDTHFTDYKITNTPFKRDILKELADACRKYDIKLELYYSCPDWNYIHSVNNGGSHQLPVPNPGDEPDEDLYIQYVKNQITELLTNYGKIYAIFWDIPPVRRDKSVNELVRKLQPHILINDRGYDEGDYSTPERDDTASNFSRLCEACQSVGYQSWGYRENEDYFTSQSLISSVSKILIKGGNYLLNVGPNSLGEIPERSANIFRDVGTWYKKIYNSIVDTKYIKSGDFEYTVKGNSLFLHLPAAFGCSGAVLKPITIAPEKLIFLNGEEKIEGKIEYTPVDYNGKDNTPHLHLYNIPAEKYIKENMVIQMDFNNIDDVLNLLNNKTEKRIL